MSVSAIRQPALQALYNGFNTATSVTGAALTHGWTLCATRRMAGSAPQLVLQHAGGVFHDELDQYNPYFLRVLAYHTDQLVALAKIEEVIAFTLTHRAIGGQEFPWVLEGWTARTMHPDTPDVREAATITDEPNVLWEAAVVIAIILSKSA